MGLAPSNCPSHDARIAIWVKNGWAALYWNPSCTWNSTWSSESLDKAKAIAMRKVPNGHLECWVSSDS